MRNHFVSLVLYSLAIGALFSLFMRDETRERFKFGAVLALSMVGAAVAVAWLMYLAD